MQEGRLQYINDAPGKLDDVGLTAILNQQAALATALASQGGDPARVALIFGAMADKDAPAMLSQPEGCANALTRVIAGSAERGPGSAAKYSVAYDGVRTVMTVLIGPLDLDQLEATASRCEVFLTFFDPMSEPIPVTTTKLPSPRPDMLVYQQTIQLGGDESSVYFAFENVAESGMFGMAFPTEDPAISVKGTLPQTFLDIMDKQANRLE